MRGSPWLSAAIIIAAACGRMDQSPTTPQLSAGGRSTFSTSSQPGVLTGPIVNPANGHSYFLLATATWTNSEASAISLGGHLVTINDQAENDWIFSTFSEYGGVHRALWIGFTDQSAEGVFTWVSGETPAFANWSVAQPNNGITASRGPESFAHFWPSDFGFPPGTWNDYVDLEFVDGASPLNGVVELGEANVAPIVNGVFLPGAPVAVASPVGITASFTDGNLFDRHTGTISWGDAATSAGEVSESNGSGTLGGTHSYSSAGVYAVEATVSDPGLSGSRSSALDVPSYVVVYDPAGGFVTGGGWISSHSGAYLAAPALTGKASFGFVAVYKKGARVPTGNTEFQFHAALLNFTSSAYQWLVVSGAKAQFKGLGTINGAGNYGFLLSAVDGQVIGGGGADRFRIKIWDAGSGAIVYDNELGAGDGDTAVTALGGGSIVIHP